MLGAGFVRPAAVRQAPLMCALHAVMLSGMFALSCVPEQVDISKSFEHPVQTDMRPDVSNSFQLLVWHAGGHLQQL